MTNHLNPTSLNGIRSLGRQISRDQSMKRNAALNIAAQQVGYENYAHAQKLLSAGSTPTMRPIRSQSPRRLNGTMNEFHQKALSRWGEGVLAVNPNLESSLEWTSPTDIAATINHFVGGQMNHVHFPTGGGFDVECVQLSNEDGCLELVLGHSTRHLFKPRRLLLEYIAEAPGESFLLLETDTILPVEVDITYYDYPGKFEVSRQEVVRVDDEYYPRVHWDEDHLGIDEDGREIEMPDTAHVLVRWENGKFMFVSKGTLWNGSSKTYRGLHNGLSAQRIRETILAAMPDIAA